MLYFIGKLDIVPVQNKVEVKYSNSVVENTPSEVLNKRPNMLPQMIVN